MSPQSKPVFIYLRFISTTLLLFSSIFSQAQDISDTISVQVASQQTTQQSQKKIDQLDSQTQQILNQYRRSLSELNDLQIYNIQLQRQIDAQQKALLSKKNELSQLQISRQQIMPHMLHMLKVFTQFIELDIPFLSEERNNRLQHLQQTMDNPSMTLGEKYRRLLEAYRIEAEYGHHIEAYSGQVKIKQQSVNVEFLRLGRIGLYYLSLDGSYAAVWDKQQKSWINIEKKHLPAIKQAILVAKKLIPPELLKLPLSAPEKHQ